MTRAIQVLDVAVLLLLLLLGVILLLLLLLLWIPFECSQMLPKAHKSSQRLPELEAPRSSKRFQRFPEAYNLFRLYETL